jgi:transposase
VQVAETGGEATLAPGEPTRNFIVGIVTHPAAQSDEAGAVKMEAEPAAMGLGKPPGPYVDGAYGSAQRLAAAAAEGRELVGPAPPASDNNQGRFTTEPFPVEGEERTALCPAGHPSPQCSRLEEAQSGKGSDRFEWSSRCTEGPLRSQGGGPKQRHRTIVVGEHHRALQTRRREQPSQAFQQRMKHRNGIEGTQSELVRGHGLRPARYRRLPRVKLQNYFIGAACNVKRWIRREAWKLRQTGSVLSAQAEPVPSH